MLRPVFRRSGSGVDLRPLRLVARGITKGPLDRRGLERIGICSFGNWTEIGPVAGKVSGVCSPLDSVVSKIWSDRMNQCGFFLFSSKKNLAGAEIGFALTISYACKWLWCLKREFCRIWFLAV